LVAFAPIDFFDAAAFALGAGVFAFAFTCFEKVVACPRNDKETLARNLTIPSLLLRVSPSRSFLPLRLSRHWLSLRWCSALSLRELVLLLASRPYTDVLGRET